MAIGTTTALILAGLGAGFGASKLMSGGGKAASFSTPSALPQPPNPAASEAVGDEAARRRKSAMTKTVYGSALGSAGEAAIAKKTLLGQ